MENQVYENDSIRDEESIHNGDEYLDEFKNRLGLNYSSLSFSEKNFDLEDDDNQIDAFNCFLRDNQLRAIRDDRLESTSSKSSSASSSEKRKHLKCKNLKPFLLQDIESIRKSSNKATKFRDPKFSASMKLITSQGDSRLAQSLAKLFNLNYSKDLILEQLKQKISWKRTSEIALYNKGHLMLENSFVLDENGSPLESSKCSASSEMRSVESYFSLYDVFQCSLGDCFFLATIMGITRNCELMKFIIPLDNASKTNMKLGAYHFRFWQMGQWYDCVVDDYLPVDNNYRLIFTHNLTYPNEFWICLFEKAFAK